MKPDWSPQNEQVLMISTLMLLPVLQACAIVMQDAPRLLGSPGLPAFQNQAEVAEATCPYLQLVNTQSGSTSSIV